MNLAVIADLTRILKTEKEEVELISSSDLKRSPAEIGKRLLFLLQCDLLPGIQGKVLESKGKRDDVIMQQGVALFKKQLVWGFLLLKIAGMLFYIMLFALNQTTFRQDAWFNSFMMWLFIEIFLTSTNAVVITHVLIPAVAMGDVNKVKQKLIETIRDYQHDINRAIHHNPNQNSHSNSFQSFDHETGDETFNAAKYLYVSTRVSRRYPDLMESQLIARFNSPWPRQSYLHEVDATKGYNKGKASIC